MEGAGASVQALHPYGPLGPQTPDEARKIANGTVERHRKGKAKKRLHDLTAEKYLIHVDGENDGQWAEIMGGSIVMVPPRPGTFIRLQQNLLQPIMSHFVAYLCGIPFKTVAEAPLGRRARDKSRMATVLANHTISDQKLNSLLAEAMYIAGIYGHCPVHGTWRYGSRAINPLGNVPGMPPGYVDFWIGDPWDTVYNDGATRNSVHRMSYGRVIPTQILKNAFPEHPQIGKLKGTTDSSATGSTFDRIARKWHSMNQVLRAASYISAGESSEDLTSVLCEEVVPGYDPMYPEGLLRIVALSGRAESGSGAVGGGGDNILLHQGPLPAKRLSAVRFYSLNRFDNVLGKPYVAAIDDLQIQLNNVVTMRSVRLAKYSNPRVTAPRGAGIEEDSFWADSDAILFYNGTDRPDFMTPPMGNPDYDASIAEIEAQMFRISGWQAASRGEANAGDSGTKVNFLAKADDTIFSPIRQGFEAAFSELMALGHALTRENAQGQPFLANIVGDELSYAIDPWVRAEDLDHLDPQFKVVSGFGASPEALAETLQALVQIPAADGPLMTSDEFWDRYPNPALRPHRPNIKATKRMRLNSINYLIERLCDEAEGQYAEQVQQMPQMAAQLAVVIEETVLRKYPLLRTEDWGMSLEALDEIIHDPNSSGMKRNVCELRMNRCYEELMRLQGAGAPAGGPQDGPPNAPPGQNGGDSPESAENAGASAA